MAQWDLAVVGAGILGLAHALAARRMGKSVVVIERDAQANGASIRNFGFVTVTGQQAGAIWRHARRSRDVWAEVASKAGIPVLHRGLLVAAQRPEAEAVLDAFLHTEMGEGCRKLTAAQAREINPALRENNIRAALYSPHELRVESRAAVPALAAYLAAEGVRFLWGVAAHAVAPPRVATSAGPIDAARVVVCPGDDFSTLFADRIARRKLQRCKLHMLRLTPGRPLKLGAALMSDLSLARYLGYAERPEAAPLKAVLQAEQPDCLANGVHLIAVQSADGSLVVGDSHHYAPTPDPFQPARIDALITAELERVLDMGDWRVADRWLGTYASSDDHVWFADAPNDDARVVIVTAGCGASIAFSIAEETLASLF